MDTDTIIYRAECKLAQLGEFVAREESRLRHERWQRSAIGILDVAQARLETLRAFIGAEETRLLAQERARVSPALAQAQREREQAAQAQREREQAERREQAEAQRSPERTDKRGRKANLPRLTRKPDIHVVCPRDKMVEDASGFSPVTTVRKLVRLHTGNRKAREQFAHFLASRGATAVCLEREDGRCDISPEDFRVYHAEDDGVSRAANAVEMKAGHWPERIWYAVDCTPDALSFLISRQWCLAVEDDCPLSLPRECGRMFPR